VSQPEAQPPDDPFRQAGTAPGVAVSLGAPLVASDLASLGRPTPDVVILDLDEPGCVPKIENYLFRQLFCASWQEGIGMELAQENRRILTFEKGGVAAPVSELARRVEILERARRKGFAPLLTPGMPAFLSRKLAVGVMNAAQAQRVEEIVLNAFIHRDAAWFAARLTEFRGRCPELCRWSDLAIARATTAFDRARSFITAPGLFFDTHTGGALPDEVIRADKLKEILDIRVLGREPQTFRVGETNSVEVKCAGNKLTLSQGGQTVSVPLKQLRAMSPGLRRWRAKGTRIVELLLADTDAPPRVVNFGSGDALYVGSGEDFTNFAVVHQGRLLLVDPSETTIGNLLERGWLDRVAMIYQSHVHYDHLGGVLELARRWSAGEALPSIPVITACPVYLQMLEVLSACTGRATREFENVFPLVAPTGMGDSRGRPEADGEVELRAFTTGPFAGWTCQLLRTRHFVPTFALRLATPAGTLAYLVDSSMPPEMLRTGRNPQYDDFLNFFGAASGVDVLIADCGEVEERDDNVHIAPAALLRVFPDHAARGTLWTVHSPVTQKARDLQRFEPFDVIGLCPHVERRKRAEKFASRLLALGAFQNRAFRLTDEQARRIGRVAAGRHFQQGERILEKHEEVRHPENNKVHVVLRGEVSVAQEGQAAREGERLGPGDLFGERAIFGAEVAAMAYWQIPERRRAKVATRHEFDSGCYFTWNPGLTEEDIADEFEREPDLRARLTELFQQSRRLQRTRTAVVTSREAEVLEIKAAEFFKIFEHFVSEEELAAGERDEKIRETLGSLVLSAASASKRMRLDDFIMLVELDHLTDVMVPVMAMAAAKREGDRDRIKSLKWPASVTRNGARVDPVSRVIDANLSAFLGFAAVFHDQYVASVEIAPYLDPTLATPDRLARLVETGALDGGSDRVRAYIARYTNGTKHAKLQRQDVKLPVEFARVVAARARDGLQTAAQVAMDNADILAARYETFPPKQDVLSALYADWKTLMSEVDRAYDPSVRESYKDYLARLQTKAIANILTILLYLRMNRARGRVLPPLGEVLLWIHAAWTLDNDWAEQAAMTWDELEQIKPGDIKKDWIALEAVIEQLHFHADFASLLEQGRRKYPAAEKRNPPG
jgi:CRP-like cAMP-binding protein/ribonuclease BN (tRNA processing enzyme)